jgi:hypothetical protein
MRSYIGFVSLCVSLAKYIRHSYCSYWSLQEPIVAGDRYCCVRGGGAQPLVLRRGRSVPSNGHWELYIIERLICLVMMCSLSFRFTFASST